MSRKMDIEEHKDSPALYHKGACFECYTIKIFAYETNRVPFNLIWNLNPELYNLVSYQNINVVYYVPMRPSKIAKLRFKKIKFVPSDYENYNVTFCIRKLHKRDNWKIYHNCENFKYKNNILFIMSDEGFVYIREKEVIRIVIRRTKRKY